MTKLCVVAPPEDIFAACDGDMVFLQADWCDSLHGRTLVHFQSVRNTKYLILDNQHPYSNGETSAVVSHSKLITTARRLRANEIVIPDVLNDGDATLLAADTFLATYSSEVVNYGLQFVPQGKGLTDWIRCLSEMLERKWAPVIDTIGVPKWLGDQRMDVLTSIPDKYLVHFLGCATGWGEFEYLPRVRSWDTSCMYAAAQEDVKMRDVPQDRTFRLSTPFVEADTYVLHSNIRFVRSLLRRESVRDEP